MLELELPNNAGDRKTWAASKSRHKPINVICNDDWNMSFKGIATSAGKEDDADDGRPVVRSKPPPLFIFENLF